MNPFSPQPRLNQVQCLRPKQLPRMAYWEWGDPDHPRVLLCLHGLTRQGRDFDTLACALSEHYRVVCPDIVGRGRSDWLTDPMGYQIPAYLADIVTLLARLNAQQVHVLGTSMGGLIGIFLASMPKSPVERLVLNDVGPYLPLEALMRIGAYLGRPLHWDDETQAINYLRVISAPFGPHTQAQWLALSRPMLKPDGAGFTLHYDPQLALAFQALTSSIATASEALLWQAYDAIGCPTLLLRGAQSDLLNPETARLMTQRGPRPQLHEFSEVGHAPTLVQDDQVAAVKAFLLA